MSFRSVMAALLLMVLPLSAGAVTITSFGTLANNQSYNAGNVNLASDDLFRWDGYINGTASFTANTYVSPFLPVGIGAANILIGVKGSTLSAVTGSWGSNIINFTQVGSSWLANFSTRFLAGGLAGAQTLTINWVSAKNDQFSLNIAAVPVPAAGALLLAALGGLGLAGWRRRKTMA